MKRKAATVVLGALLALASAAPVMAGNGPSGYEGQPGGQSNGGGNGGNNGYEGQPGNQAP
jgi:hypothetical protein